MKEFLSFCLDEENECLLRGGQRIHLVPKVYALLRCLVEKPGKLVTHRELTEKLWPNTHVQPEVLKSYVRDLRAILEDDASTPRFIETLHSRGYRFIAPVRTAPMLSSGEVREASSAADASLKPILEIFDAVLCDQPQIVFVTGEIGIGKTTLCNRFERYLQRTAPDVRIVRGHCVEGNLPHEPYLPFLEAIECLLRGPERETVARVLAEWAPSWFIRFPMLAKHSLHNQAREVATGASAESLLRELSYAMERFAHDIPLVIIVEDIHWACPHTVDWIGHLARLKLAAKLMIIATLREPDLMLSGNRLGPLFRDLLASRLCRTIGVQPLSHDGVRQMLQELSPHAVVPEGLVRYLHNSSEGNPLFALAALEHLTNKNLLVARKDCWELVAPIRESDCNIPETIREMLETRLETHCTEEERMVMEAASVCGITWTSNLAAFLTNTDLERVEEICMGLVRRRFALRSAGTMEGLAGAFPNYEFVHSLYQQVLYRRVGKARRTRLHKKIHQFLEMTYPERMQALAPQLLFHAAKSEDVALLAKDLTVFGEKHIRQLDVAAAANILERAIHLLPNLPREEAAPVEFLIQVITERTSSPLS
jgi:predicted ATPase